MNGNILSQREIRRYRKQIMIPEIGVKGQEKLKLAKVLVVGAGGIGCPVLQYLTAAGVGNIAVSEFDIVDESNIQSQVLYGSEDVGKLKSIIAKNRLEQINLFADIEVINLRIGKENALKVFEKYDIIVDATNNIETSYIIDEVCNNLKKHWVHGSTCQFEGTISVFNFKGGPTYRHYKPEISNTSPKNQEPQLSGQFGVLPGITGTYMANEVIKIITGFGDILSGKILWINILNNTLNIFSVNTKSENH
jgi:sulfur-carrier protein adenylyltransferase/sulfurtransferase